MARRGDDVAEPLRLLDRHAPCLYTMLHSHWHIVGSEAHVLTDGLAGAETRMIGIVGLHRKSVRERPFPLVLLERGLSVKIQAARRMLAEMLFLTPCTLATWHLSLRRVERDPCILRRPSTQRGSTRCGF